MDGEPFTALVRPEVFVRAGDIDGAGGDECDKFMLVERKVVFTVDVFSVIAAKPMLEGVLDDVERFTETASGDGGSRAAGAIGDGERPPFILCAAPEGCLAAAGMACYGAMPFINVRIGLEIVHDAGGTPSPGGDGSP